MIQLRRARSWLAVPLAAIAVGGAAIAAPGTAGAAVTAAGPVSVPAGPGCPASMLAWVPSATALASGDPQALAPGSLSPQAGAEFGAEVLRLLAGQQVNWLGSTGCGQANTYSSVTRTGTAPAAQHRAAAAGPVATPLVNWSGFESDAGNFTGASMVWTVPAPRPSTAPAAISIWPGVGGGSSTSDLLVQAGTEQDQSGTTIAWTEVFPVEAQVPVMGMTVVAGDQMAVHVSWDKATHTAAFLVSDITRHNTKMITQPVSGSSEGSAEWIVERTEFCDNGACIYPHLLDFGSVQILNGFADQTSSGGITTGKYIMAWPKLVIHDMQPCLSTTNLAVPSQLDSQGDFVDTFDHAGPVDPTACMWRISPANAAFRAVLSSTSAAQLIDHAAGLAITCKQATLSGTTGTAKLNDPATFVDFSAAGFSACADSSGGIWSATQAAGSPWELNSGTPSLDGVMPGEIDLVSVNVIGTISGQTCKFHLNSGVPSTTGDAIFTNPDQLQIKGASLTVSGVSGAGCGTAGVHNGDTFTLSATYTTTATTMLPGPG